MLADVLRDRVESVVTRDQVILSRELLLELCLLLGVELGRFDEVAELCETERGHGGFGSTGGHGAL